jgi:hypothetical protein
LACSAWRCFPAARLYRSHTITRTAFLGYSASFAAALAAERRLSGTRAAEFDAVTENLTATR